MAAGSSSAWSFYADEACTQLLLGPVEVEHHKKGGLAEALQAAGQEMPSKVDGKPILAWRDQYDLVFFPDALLCAENGAFFDYSYYAITDAADVCNRFTKNEVVGVYVSLSMDALALESYMGAKTEKRPNSNGRYITCLAETEDIHFEWLNKPAGALEEKMLTGGSALDVLVRETAQTCICRVTLNGRQMDFVFTVEAYPELKVNGSVPLSVSHGLQRDAVRNRNYVEVEHGDILTLSNHIAPDLETLKEQYGLEDVSVRYYWEYFDPTTKQKRPLDSGDTLQYRVKEKDFGKSIDACIEVTQNGETDRSWYWRIYLCEKPPRTGDNFPFVSVVGAMLLSVLGVMMIRRRSLTGR